MPADETQLVTQDGSGTRVDTGAIPTEQTPQLNDFQKAFNQYYEGNDLMKSFASSENPFKAVADKLSEKPAPVESGLKLLTDKSTPEDVSAFKKALGAFEKAEDYKYDAPTSDDEAIKKLLPTDMPLLKAFQELALKSHMPESTWKELIGAYNQMQVEGAKTQVEIANQAEAAVKEQWAKAHGEKAPEVEKVFQKYFAQATPAESELLATLSQQQLAALGSVVYRQEKRLGSEDKIDAGNLGSSTMSSVDYVAERSRLLSQQRSLESQGKAWSGEAEEVKKKLAELSDRFANASKA